MESTTKTFTGTDNTYLEFAQKGKVILGVSVVYAYLPKLPGSLLVRFVAYIPGSTVFLDDGYATLIDKVQGGLKSIQHFTPRGWGSFSLPDGSKFIGLRLNRVFLPVFNPAPLPLKFLTMCDNNLVWEMLTSWVAEQMYAAEFAPTDPGADFKSLIRDLVGGSLDLKDDQYKMVLAFPDLSKSEEPTTDEEK